MPSTEELVLVIVANIIHGLFIIAIIYKCIRFYSYIDCQAIQKRYPLLVQLMNFFIILYLLFNIILKITFIYDGDRTEYYQNKSFGNTLALISVFLYGCSLHGMVIMLIARSWLIYFNIQYGIQIQVCVIHRTAVILRYMNVHVEIPQNN